MTRRSHLLLSDIRRHFIDPDDLPERIPVADVPSLLPTPEAKAVPTVAIHYVSAGQPEFDNVQSLLALATTDRLSMQFVGVTSGPYMDQGRNRATFNVLALTDCEWMLCLDDDVADPVRMVDQILDLVGFATTHGVHVVGGCYASPHLTPEGTTENYVVAYHHPPDDLDLYLDFTVPEVDAMDPTDRASCEVAAVGTGFLLIHRSVLELMPFVYQPPQPWFAELTVNDAANPDSPLGTHLGEDLTFCRRLWMMGVPVHLHPYVRLIHFKKVGITMPPHPDRLP